MQFVRLRSMKYVWFSAHSDGVQSWKECEKVQMKDFLKNRPELILRTIAAKALKTKMCFKLLQNQQL